MKRFLIPLCIFLAVFILFMAGINHIENIEKDSQYDSLYNALSRSITHCYAVEGQYPPNITYLEEHYGLTWDHTQFIVDYQPVASNIMPSFRVIPLENNK